MNEAKVIRILMDMATVEEGLVKGHEAKAKLLRELAAEIEFPDKEHSPEKKPDPTPKSPFQVKIVPLANDDFEFGSTDEIMKAFEEWINKKGITVLPTFL